MKKTISTRQLLREFPKIRNELIVSEVEAIYVPAGEGKRLKITLETDKTPLEEAWEIVQRNDFSSLQRPDIDILSHE